jgi:hypothetical protein
MLLRVRPGGSTVAFWPLRGTAEATYARSMLPRVRSVAVAYYIGVTLLVLGLIGAVLMLSGIARPSGEPIEIAAPLGEDCLQGERSPGCFTFEVRNATDTVVSIECLVIPAEGTTATFGEGGSTTAFTVQPGASKMLRTAVDIEGDDDQVAAPSPECSTVDT